MGITVGEFQYIANLVGQNSGIVLEAGKEYLVEMRLAPLLKQLQLPSLGDLIAYVHTKSDDKEVTAAITDAMTTNETSFFRDPGLFEALRKQIMPELIDKQSHELHLNIWCAACSTGQEPYTIAIMILEHFPVVASTWNVRIWATDICKATLQRALEGKYSQLEVNRGLPAANLVKYFVRHGLTWRVTDDVRRLVEFAEMNLIKTWPSLPQMDLVLLRNVLIYFNIETKKQILQKMQQVLKPTSYLFLGSAETTINIENSYKIVMLDKTVGYRLNANQPQ
jgi:chemotaxis protein methyltransferase CheR